MPAVQENQTISYEDKTSQLEAHMDRLKYLYEQYFIGREKMPPSVLRKDVEKGLQFLVGNLNTIKNTAIRFKIQGLQGKFVSLRRIWDRNMQQIEAGTFAPHRFKLKLKEREAKKPSAEEKTKKSAEPQEKKSAAVETLMNQYLAAKQKCNEATSGINYESFSKIISQQSKDLKTRFKCKTVRFKVVIENGKPKLKATPV